MTVFRRLTAVVVLALLGTQAVSGAGLLAPTDQKLPPLRVSDHLVDVKIVDGVAYTTVHQEFVNDTKQRLEATYVFPLPEQADLTDFQMSFNGKMVQGKVLPAEEAKRTYEQIVRQMKDPGLIEFIGRRLLQMRVFPIEPESKTKIQVSYQQICRPMSGMTAFHYPLRTREAAGQAYGTVRFTVDLNTKTPLKNIWSPSHAVEIVRGESETSAKIAYEAQGGSLEDDFLLLYGTDASDLGLSVVAHKPDADENGHFVLMLTPKQMWPEDEHTPQDVVLVLDTSGSMAGDKIEQARAALKFCVNRLDEKDHFTVVRFSTGFDPLFDGLAAADDANRKRAVDWIDQFKPAGGTNITDTLGYVMGLQDDRPDSDRPFVVVFLTDGRGNRTAPEILNTLADRSNSGQAVRVFPFGLGHDVNTQLLDGLADAYTGRPTYVQPGENLELVLGDFFSVISEPVLTNLRLMLPNIAATERFPASLGDLYHGQQIVLAGVFAKEATGAVRLTANRAGERVEFSFPKVAFRHDENAHGIPGVWAGRKIAFLIDQIRTNGESTELVEEVLALSQKYGIQTPYTSWFVNPNERERPVVLGARMRASRGLGQAPGAAGAPLTPELQQRRLGRITDGSFGGGGSFDRVAGDLFYATEATEGEVFAGLDDLALAEALTSTSGEVATVLARKNAEFKVLRSQDEGRLDAKFLAYRELDGRWYNRIGQVLVDERVGENTQITVVRFASPAYFDLVTARPDLRKALAASKTVVVMVAENTALLVSDRGGVEKFSADQREQFGFGER